MMKQRINLIATVVTCCCLQPVSIYWSLVVGCFDAMFCRVQQRAAFAKFIDFSRVDSPSFPKVECITLWPHFSFLGAKANQQTTKAAPNTTLLQQSLQQKLVLFLQPSVKGNNYYQQWLGFVSHHCGVVNRLIMGR